MTATGLCVADTAPAAPSHTAHSRPSARPQQTGWPATRQAREQVWTRLTQPPFAPDTRVSRRRHEVGLGLLLDWLQDQPGRTWQDRWLVSGADTHGGSWRQIPALWLRDRGHHVRWRHDTFFQTFPVLIGADLIRPSPSWLVTAAFRRGSLVNVLAHHRDCDGFARLRALCSADADVSPAAASRTSYRAALILAAKGGTLNDITTGDVLELLEVEADARGTTVGATHLFYRALHTMGVLGADAPATLPRRCASCAPAGSAPAPS